MEWLMIIAAVAVTVAGVLVLRRQRRNYDRETRDMKSLVSLWWGPRSLVVMQWDRLSPGQRALLFHDMVHEVKATMEKIDEPRENAPSS